MHRRHSKINRKSFIQGTVLALAITFGAAATAQTAPAAKSRLVLQVSDADPAKWALALNNAKNVQQELGAGKVDIEIVAYGPGIGMLKAEAPTANRISEATQAGIKVVDCENAMTVQKLTKTDMHAAIGYAPSGVVEIMSRQSESYAYVRP